MSGVYLFETKTKGDIDELQVQRQLRFDLQTMLYLVALQSMMPGEVNYSPKDLRGVRYNVVRRPLSGGKGSIRPHAAKSTKTKITPAETDAEFFERLRRDYIAAEPSYWFFRVRSEVSAKDIETFKTQFLTPILEQLCDWWTHISNCRHQNVDSFNQMVDQFSRIHWRHPFGGYNVLDEGGSSEYDAFFDTGSEAGLHQTDKLFSELTDA